MPRHTIVITPTPEVGGYAVDVPALPGCFSRGDSVEEELAAIDNAPAWDGRTW
jgi:antitoxin HicB